MKTIICILLGTISFSFLSAQNSHSFIKCAERIAFKENRGQLSDQYYKARPDILYSGTDGSIDFYLRSNGVSYQLRRVDAWKNEQVPSYLARGPKKERRVAAQTTIYRIDLNWLGALVPEMRPGESTAGFENYYSETCPNGAVNVKDYTAILYSGLYQGIDVKWYEKNSVLEYDYIVSAFADYKKIRIEIKGAQKIYLNKSGDLMIRTPLGTITEQKPVVMQGNRKLEARWVVEGSVISFDITNVDHSLAMVIDPMVRLWGTYYGGSGDDASSDLVSDIFGNVYISGWTQSSSNIATVGAHQFVFGGTAPNSGDAFVAKFNSAGVRQWATYYGGAQDDWAGRSVVDANGNVYMVGGTSTTNAAVMATPGAHQSTPSGNTSTVMPSDAFLVKFNSTGVRQWGTYYGGTKSEWGGYVAVSTAGDILMSGACTSTNGISTPGSHQPVFGGGFSDGYLVRFNAAGVRQWATYYGGNGPNEDIVDWCDFGSTGDIYLSGYTESSAGIATPGSHQPTIGGNLDAFLVKFNPAGVRQWATYYGGPFFEYLGRGNIDASENIYLCGATGGISAAITTPGCHQSVYGGGAQDGMFVKFNSAGVRQWGTYYGGTGMEYGGGVTLDPAGNVYFCGATSSSTGTAIATYCAFNSIYNGGSTDVFLEKFTPAGTRLWGTYFGSIYTDEPAGTATDPSGNIYLAGTTYANSGTVMATAGAHQTTYGGQIECFLQKFDGCIPGNAASTTPPANLLVCPGQSATLTATCGNWYGTATGTMVLGTGDTFTSGPITTNTTFYVEDFGCGVVNPTRAAVSVTVSTAPSLSVSSSNNSPCVGESIILTATGANTYSWTHNSAFSAAVTATILAPTIYTVNGINPTGCWATLTLAIVPSTCAWIKTGNLPAREIAICPNPNTGRFSVRSQVEMKLQLTNELGQLLQEIHLSPSNNFEVILVDRAAGIYFLKCEGKMTEKVVIVK